MKLRRVAIDKAKMSNPRGARRVAPNRLPWPRRGIASRTVNAPAAIEMPDSRRFGRVIMRPPSTSDARIATPSVPLSNARDRGSHCTAMTKNDPLVAILHSTVATTDHAAAVTRARAIGPMDRAFTRSCYPTRWAGPGIARRESIVFVTDQPDRRHVVPGHDTTEQT